MGTRSSERVANIHKLELRRRDNIHKTEGIFRDEEARLLKLRMLALRDEAANLKDAAVQKDDTITSLRQQSDVMRVELDDSKKAARAHEVRAKKQEIELANLRAEVHSLNGSVENSGKALQEKFALRRELDRLLPEMEHLQSQFVNHKETVAEKNDLRRQLDSVQAELENEKRSRQKVQFKKDEATISELKSQLANAEQKLTAEAKARDRARKEHDRELAEAQAQSERLEERVEALKAKYKTVHSDLKETRVQLQQCQKELEKAKKKTIRSAGGKDAAKKAADAEAGVSRKRRVQEMSFEDITIQTPGNEDVTSKRPAKKRGDKSTLGEKSTFSITPFLNRTGKSLSDESLEVSAHDESGMGPDTTFMGKGDDSGHVELLAEPDFAEEAAEAPEPVRKRKVQVKSPAEDAAPKPAPRPRGRPKTKGLAAAAPAHANKTMTKKGPATAGLKPEAVAEPEKTAGALDEQENVAAKGSRKTPALQSKAPEGDVRKKRRKLLGAANQTLFDGDGDGDDGEAMAMPAKPVLLAGKRFKTQLGGGVKNAFAGGSFSPLKRDRRGVNASFLV